MIVQDTEFDSVGDRLKKHWALHNVEINPGASEADLRSFEAIYRVVLPNDLRDYFWCVNGMPQYVVDEAMIRFWMLEELKPLTEGALQYSDPAYIHRPESLFLFADFSIWSHAYAIRLESSSIQSNEIVVVGYKTPVVLVPSFSEFVDRYLTDKNLLH